MSEYLPGAARFAIVLAVAVVAGVAVTIGSALVGHEVLVLVYGKELAPIDDTLPMIASVAFAYLAGIVTGLIVLVLGWRRFARRPRTVGEPPHPRDWPATESGSPTCFRADRRFRAVRPPAPRR